jgi:hypothetical protein
MGGVEVGKMFFMLCVIKNVRETIKGEFHGKFKGRIVVTVEVVA